MIAPTLHSPLPPIHADQREILRQHLGVCQIVERWHHQPFGQIAAGAEDHHGAGSGRSELTSRRWCNLGFARCQDRLGI